MAVKDFGISNLKAAVGEVLRPNRFEVIINPPAAVIAMQPDLFTYDTQLKISVLTERGEIPGRTLATVDTNRAGAQFKLGYDMTYNDITFSVIADERMAGRKAFELWLDYIYKRPDTARNQGGVTKFYDSYVGTLKLKQLNSAGEPVVTYTLEGAYPIQVSSVPFSAEEENSYQRFTVDITYRYHTHEFNKV